MKNKTTISIGIPAYNEEVSITSLIKKILKQNQKNIKVCQIIIVSDGSTDNTSKVVKLVKNKKVTLIEHKERLGKVLGLNEILKKSNGDVLVLLDADISIRDRNFLEKISKPFLSNKNLGLVGALTCSIAAEGNFERIIGESHEFKNKMYRKIKSGNNLFLCHGRALACTRKFYRVIKFINDYPTDAQAYFFCITKGFGFKFERSAKVYFRSPANLKDHYKQHSRFIAGEKSFESLFDKDVVKKEYFIPFNFKLNFIITFFRSHLIDSIGYLIIYTYLRFFKSGLKIYRTKWEISSTTKGVIV